MATVQGQPLYAHHVLNLKDETQTPPSPTLTNPDLILPHDTSYPTSSPSRSSIILSDSSYAGSPPGASQAHRRNDSNDSGAELGIATAVVMPVRLSAGPPANVPRPTHLLTYQGYEHGAPLSDIGEEGETETEDNADRATIVRDRDRSPSPDEVDEIAAEVEKLASPPLRHKKRLSNISVESAESDKTEWGKFDTSKLASDRVAADIANARNAADSDSGPSRRNSKEVDEELTALNDRAEQILENARKRLSHMEDNLSKARHSILLSSSRSSPNMHELGLGQQPGGGLYRSISQSAANRRSRGFPVKPNSVLSHGRAGSDNIVAGNHNRLSRTPEVRSVSALEYGRPWLGVTTPEKLQSSHSPTSSRSFSSPLRILAEEAESPSTVKTSPDASSTPNSILPKGLGIHPTATRGLEDLTPSSRHDHSSTPPALERSNSQASTRSARELKDQMSEMKSRIAELRNKAQADTLRRRSMQSLRTSSPFTSSSPEPTGIGVQPSSPSATTERASTVLGPAVGANNGWRSVSQQGEHPGKDLTLGGVDTPSRMLQTPVTNRLLTVATPLGPSSGRTDRNTPNLANRSRKLDDEVTDFESQIVPSSNFEGEERNLQDDEDEDEVFANEEEQIYLNEVLEESLHEPDVPTIPLSYLEQSGGGEERHEDRLDAFDYENMFLHSAMGTYTGISDSDNDSDAGSIHTRQRDPATPIRRGSSSASDGEMNDGNAVTSPVTRGKLRDVDEELMSEPSSPIRSFPVAPKALTATRSPFKPPTKPWMKPTRSNSMDSTSSAATFETATEGHGSQTDQDDSDGSDGADDILNWGNATNSNLTSTYPDQTLPSSPLGVAVRSSGHNRHDSGSAMELNGAHTTVNGTTLEHVQPASEAEGSVGGDSNNAGQHRTSSNPRYNGHDFGIQHWHNRSLSTEPDELDGERTPLASTFQHDRINLPASQVPTRTPSTLHHAHNASTSTTATLRQAPLARSSSSASRRLSSRLSARRPESSAQNRANTHAKLSPSPATNQVSPPVSHSVHPANTEILMESLIKLADPTFSIRPDTRFAELDKELVLKLLRALGGVCNGVLHAAKRGDAPTVKDLRGRLRDGEEVLLHGLGVDDEDEYDNDERFLSDINGDSQTDDVDDDEGEVDQHDAFSDSDIQTVKGLGIVNGNMARVR